MQQGARVFGVLDQFRVRAGGGDAFRHVHGRAAAPAIGGLGVEAVLRVHHYRNAGQPAGDAAEDARLRVVRVQDVGLLDAQQAHQLPEGAKVVGDARPAGEAVDCDVADAVCRERGDVGAGGRHADHLVAGCPERTQLRAEQPVEAHVGGREVHQSRPVANRSATGAAHAH